jgi:general stress protein YciG
MAENRNQDGSSNRGFGAMDDQQQQEISSQDGRSSEGKSGRSNRGFASMDPQKQKEIASLGGRAAHKMGVAHEWSSDEARAAGRKGGQNSHGGGRTRGRSGGEDSGESR